MAGTRGDAGTRRLATRDWPPHRYRMPPTCDTCAQALAQIDLSAGQAEGFGKAPVLWEGVMCAACGKVECARCKGPANRKPCRWCGGEVEPAIQRYLKRSAAAASTDTVAAQGWEAFGGLLVLFGGVGGLLVALTLRPGSGIEEWATRAGSVLVVVVAMLSLALAAVLNRFDRTTVVWFEAWRLSFTATAAWLAYVNPPDGDQATSGTLARLAMPVWVAVCILLATWPIGRSIRRKTR